MKWYERARRYGQTNLTEIDPIACDIDFWKEYWKRTDTQAIIVNAGGIVAFYPSKYEQYRAAKLGGRDFFGEFVQAGREHGLAILARMDINRTTKDFYEAHPDWFARKRDGSPYVVQGRYQSCLNSAYYKEYIPGILIELIERYHPDGFTDNSWTGIPRTSICYCDNCCEGYRQATGSSLPERADYADPEYRRWIRWSYQCRMDNWDLFNQVTTSHGGEDCLWLGMVNANFVSGHASFCDLREVARRSKIMMVDHQSRDGNGYEQNSLNGVLLHQMAGWDTIIPESMANYVRGLQSFRRAANPPLELALWVYEGIAGGITPWWHTVGGAQEDRRIFEQCVPLLQWHSKHEQYLYNRLPVANVGVLWSQDNVEFFGREEAEDRVAKSWRGINMALTRAGIPFLPINLDDLETQAMGMDLLILPEIALLTDGQWEALQNYTKTGGNLLVIGNAGVLDGQGNPLPVSRWEDTLGVRFQQVSFADKKADASWENPVLHNYLRIAEKQHPAFDGFENTDTLAMGGTYKQIAAGPDTRVLATYIPGYPIYPPEFSWTDVTHTDQPVITEKALAGGGKAIYVAWDLDSSYGRCALPDHGDLLGNLAHYLIGERWQVRVSCDAYIDFKLYKQENRLVLHLINGNHTGFEHGYAEKNLPVGPVKISLRIPGFTPATAIATEDGEQVGIKPLAGGVELSLPTLGVHQMIIME